MSIILPETDEDGFLLHLDDWSEEVGRAMARADGEDLDQQKWDQILKAREYYQQFEIVPPVRVFAKHIGTTEKALRDIWKRGPMNPIAKYGGLPKPTGCVQAATYKRISAVFVMKSTNKIYVAEMIAASMILPPPFVRQKPCPV